MWQSYSASSLEHLHISGFTGPSAWGSWSACPNLEVSDKEGESHPCKLTFYATRRAHTLPKSIPARGSHCSARRAKYTCACQGGKGHQRTYHLHSFSQTDSHAFGLCLAGGTAIWARAAAGGTEGGMPTCTRVCMGSVGDWSVRNTQPASRRPMNSATAAWSMPEAVPNTLSGWAIPRQAA